MMKIRILILLLILGNLLFAQKNPKQYIGLAIGPSFPTGQYAATNLSDSTSGFAKTGIAAEFTYSYRITHNIGFQAIINYSGNSVDYQSFKSQLQSTNPGYAISVEIDRNWSSAGIMVGPFLTLPISDELSWDIKGLFGVYSAYSPAYIIYARDSLDLNAPPSEFTKQPTKAISYSYLISTGIKYKLSDYYILLFADYVGSPLQFSDAAGWKWNSEPYSTSFKQNINFFTLTIGLGYHF